MSEEFPQQSAAPAVRSWSLAERKPEQIEEVMKARLHNHQHEGPPLDPHGNVLAYEWLVQEYRRGTEQLRTLMCWFANKFVGELPDDREWPRFARAKNRMQVERLSEVFAFLMCRLFVFGNDLPAFVQTHLAALGRSCAIDGVLVLPNVVQTSELLLRLFLVFREFPEPLAFGSADAAQLSSKNEDLGALFKRFFELASPILPGRDRLWNGVDSPGGEYLWQLIRSFMPEATPHLDWLRTQALAVYGRFRANVQPRIEPYDEALGREVRDAISEGTPLSLCLTSDGEELDALVLICRVLQSYLSRITSVDGKALHLLRGPHKQEVNYSLLRDVEPSRTWNEFQIDRGVTQMFCPVPEDRGKRLSSHIAMFKTFWNIAAFLRARRLQIVIQNNWSREELDGDAGQKQT